MIGTTITMIAIVLMMTAFVTHRVKGGTVKAEWVAPLWGGGACLVIAVFAAVTYSNQIRIYDRCVFTAERSLGSRVQTIQLYDTIDAATGTVKYTSQTVIPGEPSLRRAIDINLPVLDPTDCEHP